MFGFMPTVHAAITIGIAQAQKQTEWGWFVLEAASCIGGAMVLFMVSLCVKISREREANGFCQFWGKPSNLPRACFGGAVMSTFDRNRAGNCAGSRLQSSSIQKQGCIRSRSKSDEKHTTENSAQYWLSVMLVRCWKS